MIARLIRALSSQSPDRVCKRAQSALATMVAANRRSPEIVSYRARRTAALKGLGRVA